MAKRSCSLYCAVTGCFNSSLNHPEISYFKLPGNTERRRHWLELISREDLADKPNFYAYRVCEKHFNVEDIRRSLLNRKLLKCTAFPKLLLPSSSNIVREKLKQKQTDEICTQTDNATDESNAQASTILFCNTSRKRKFQGEEQLVDENSNTSDSDSLSQEVKSAADENIEEDVTLTSYATASVANNQTFTVSSNTVLKKGNISQKIDQIHKAIVKIDEIANSVDKNGDEFDTFGKYIATTLRSLPGELGIAAKIDIQKAVVEIQLKALKQASQPSMLPYGTATTATYDPLNPGYLILKPEPYADEDMSTISFTAES